jgi:hypothetical protein
MYVWYSEQYESDMKEDILSVFWITYTHYQQWNLQYFK